jgi:hypothetical protein
MSEKIIGYLLLVSGIIIILLTGVNIYQILTLKARPVQLFHFNSLSIDANQLTGGQPEIKTEGLTAEQAQAIQNILKTQTPTNQKIEVVPANVLNDTLNLFAHLFLLGFIASVGYRISCIGVFMLRPIVVKLKEKNATPPTQKA